MTVISSADFGAAFAGQHVGAALMRQLEAGLIERALPEALRRAREAL